MTHTSLRACLRALCAGALGLLGACDARIAEPESGANGAHGERYEDAGRMSSSDSGSHGDPAGDSSLDAGVDSAADNTEDASSADGSAEPPEPPAGRSFSADRATFGLAGESRCADSDVLLCEGFEAAALDTTTWSVETWGKGSATLDGTRAARGNQSIHITQPSTVSRVMLRETKTLAATGNHFFGRFFLYLPYAPPALSCNADGCSNLVHWSVASAGGNYLEGGKTYRPDVRTVGAVNQRMMVNVDGGPRPEVGASDQNAPAGYERFDSSHTNQWMCFEFEYAGEGASAELRVYWDGQEHPALHHSAAALGEGVERWPIPKYDYVQFGFEHYQDFSAFVPSFDAWIDEIAIDDERIGCVL